ncbi:Hypothetical protein [Corynebacterium glutamicum ATCC 13032]|uniref:Uncharacterized protein n=1 Tax=Corynebacterium glutamicum (strain ATCC 13032 / DSM 20300 / JCM 1318 / BCRC 11384 / CCUG 27702 / LMG 3730 / NBRC 12168 / NCIMB 10025 / NRRL B-2784 / 534) TaxID=196627 RepID=Q8NL98_CORGL|nr:Hypothetical protein [Corynebacterium glutamicum ATCC 13032]
MLVSHDDMPFPQLDHDDGGIPINFSIFAFVQVTELKIGLTAVCGKNFFGVNFKSQQRNTPSLAHLASTRESEFFSWDTSSTSSTLSWEAFPTSSLQSFFLPKSHSTT